MAIGESYLNEYWIRIVVWKLFGSIVEGLFQPK